MNIVLFSRRIISVSFNSLLFHLRSKYEGNILFCIFGLGAFLHNNRELLHGYRLQRYFFTRSITPAGSTAEPEPGKNGKPLTHRKMNSLLRSVVPA